MEADSKQKNDKSFHVYHQKTKIINQFITQSQINPKPVSTANQFREYSRGFRFSLEVSNINRKYIESSYGYIKSKLIPNVKKIEILCDKC